MNQRIKVDREGDTVVSIEAAIEWKYAQDPETMRFIAVCVPLNITLEADSVTELFPLMGESMENLFDLIARDGTIDEFLATHNWKPRVQQFPRRVHMPIKARNVSFRPVALNDLQLSAC